MIWPTDGLHVF